MGKWKSTFAQNNNITTTKQSTINHVNISKEYCHNCNVIYMNDGIFFFCISFTKKVAICLEFVSKLFELKFATLPMEIWLLPVNLEFWWWPRNLLKANFIRDSRHYCNMGTKGPNNDKLLSGLGPQCKIHTHHNAYFSCFVMSCLVWY